MKHRHLNHEEYTLAAIDSVISRGKWKDWVDMRSAMWEDPSLFDDVERVCNNYIHDPYEQRYHFWKNYVQKYREDARMGKGS